jgi:two-component system chemotaxis response regulator CheB
MDVLKGLNGLPVPIVVTQHMPKMFTALLARHIEQACRIPTFEGEEGMEVKRGHIYVAPGGYHMTFRRAAGQLFIHLTEEPPENYCRPSVNPMLRSLKEIYGARILTLILTGMGNDGSQMCHELAALGAQVIAQDEATSVVWGMPAAVAQAGICSAVLPLDQISPWIRNAFH